MKLADPPLLSPRWRLRAFALVLVCAAVGSVLGIRYAHHTRPGTFDRAVDGWFLANVNHRTALWFADLGNAPVVLVLSVVVLGCCVWLRYPRGVMLAVLAPACATSLTEYVLQPLVHRTKDGYLAYPSGHMTGWCTLTVVVVLIASGPLVPRRAAAWVAAVAAVVAVGCGLGLIASDYHYATDVIGGLAVAVGTTLALALLIDASAPLVSPRMTDPGARSGRQRGRVG